MFHSANQIIWQLMQSRRTEAYVNFRHSSPPYSCNRHQEKDSRDLIHRNNSYLSGIISTLLQAYIRMYSYSMYVADFIKPTKNLKNTLGKWEQRWQAEHPEEKQCRRYKNTKENHQRTITVPVRVIPFDHYTRLGIKVFLLDRLHCFAYDLKGLLRREFSKI